MPRKVDSLKPGGVPIDAGRVKLPKFQRSQPDPLPPTELTFEEKIETEYYKKLVTTPYSYSTRLQYQTEVNAARATFVTEAIAYAIKEGVPKKYAPKVLNYAWQEGHSSGYSEIYNQLCGLIEIFQEN